MCTTMCATASVTYFVQEDYFDATLGTQGNRNTEFISNLRPRNLKNRHTLKSAVFIIITVFDLIY